MSNESTPSAFAEVQDMAEAVRANVARVIVSKLDVIDLLLVASCRFSVLVVEDPFLSFIRSF